MEQGIHTGTVAQVEFVMRKVRVRGKESLLVPAGITPHAEEICAQVVIDAVNLPSQPAKVIDYFGAN
jgi:hypothetical protein